MAIASDSVPYTNLSTYTSTAPRVRANLRCVRVCEVLLQLPSINTSTHDMMHACHEHTLIIPNPSFTFLPFPSVPQLSCSSDGLATMMVT